MTGRNFFGARLAAGLLVVIGLVDCGDGEAAQRKAFIEFLQTRIIGKPGVHVPKLTPQEAGTFGDYATHYAVIADFNAKLDQAVSKPLQHALEAGAPRSLDEVVTRRTDIAAIGAGMAGIRAALDPELAAADDAHSALKQPDDLKPVYDSAYDRDVTQPANALALIFPDADEAMKSILSLADFIAAHRDAIKIKGSMIEVGDPLLQRPLSMMIDALCLKQEAIQKAQQRLQVVVTGG
jgi:hypothetical protein